MKISGKLSGDLVSLHIKANDSNDGKEANVDFDCLVDKKKSIELFGEDFEQLAFGSMQTITAEGASDEESSETIRHLQDTIRAGKKITFGEHKVIIAGKTIKAKPSLRTISTRQGSEAVIAKLRIPIPVKELELLGKLLGKVNDVVELEFNPSQATIFDDNGKANETGTFGAEAAAAH